MKTPARPNQTPLSASQIKDITFKTIGEKFGDEIAAVIRARSYHDTAREAYEKAEKASDTAGVFWNGLTIDGAQQHQRFMVEQLGNALMAWIDQELAERGGK